MIGIKLSVTSGNNVQGRQNQTEVGLETEECCKRWGKFASVLLDSMQALIRVRWGG